MEIDYSPFLHVLQNGSIWWPLADAVKLGAGYLPMRDDERNLTPVLRAKNNRVRANERTLFSEFSQDHYTEAHPRILERDDSRYVEAHEFLSWLSQHLAAQTQPAMLFPDDLSHAVRKATGAPVEHSTVLPIFESLTVALEGWFDRPLAELPEALRQRVEQEFVPMPWDKLSADRRRSVTRQLDYQRDPAMERERQFWWDFFDRMDALKKQIAQWEEAASPTASDLALREARLVALRQELARMEAQQRQARGDYYPERKRVKGEDETSSLSQGSVVRYLAYPKAMHQLTARLGATPEELAAWVWMGPKDGGIAAYMNANELDPPPQFHYTVGSDNPDYVAPLMACWFASTEIDQFTPTERYITGKTLIERWGSKRHLNATAFIRAKIAESRLLDMHPIYGGTVGTFAEEKDFPALSTGLFALSEVERVEDEDFGERVGQQGTLEVGSSEWRSQNAAKAANAKHDKPGGARDKKRQLLEIWSSGKYTSRDRCAEEECGALGMSFAAARKALTNAP